MPSELGSESLVLQSYYPAPLGVYAQLTATDQTLLARDAGKVGIGVLRPVQKLDVGGNVNVTGSLFASQDVDAGGGVNAVGDVTAQGNVKANDVYLSGIGKWLSTLTGQAPTTYRQYINGMTQLCCPNNGIAVAGGVSPATHPMVSTVGWPVWQPYSKYDPVAPACSAFAVPPGRNYFDIGTGPSQGPFQPNCYVMGCTLPINPAPILDNMSFNGAYHFTGGLAWITCAS